MSTYDPIARIYDPWSASVIEDISFYVEEAVASGGPVVELGVGTGRIAIPTAASSSSAWTMANVALPVSGSIRWSLM